jgi:hypothetical protein
MTSTAPAVPFAKGALSSLGKAWSRFSLIPAACAATRSASQQQLRMKTGGRPTLDDWRGCGGRLTSFFIATSWTVIAGS